MMHSYHMISVFNPERKMNRYLKKFIWYINWLDTMTFLIMLLLMFREELIASLQAEEQERQWYYTQLELIAQKIRNIPLSSLHSVSTSVYIVGSIKLWNRKTIFNQPIVHLTFLNQILARESIY